MEIVAKCPYCKQDNFVQTNDEWERPKCYNCGGIFHFRKIQMIAITSFENQGEEAKPTTQGEKEGKVAEKIEERLKESRAEK